MKLKDSLNADRETLKRLDKKARVRFIWDYYKLPIIAAGVCVALLAAVLITNLGRSDTVMYAVFVNTDLTDEARDPSPLNDLLSSAGVDMRGKKIDVTDTLYLGHGQSEEYDVQTLQVLSALFGISDLDLFAADEEVFRRYANQNAFADLSKLIDPQLLDSRREDLYYYDTEDGQHILGGIVLHPGSPLHTAGYYHADVVVGAAIKGENLDRAILFLKALLENG